MKRILVATDLSTRSGQAIHRGVVLAQQFDAMLEVTTMVEELFFEDVTQQKIDLAERALAAQVAAVPDSSDVKVTRHVGVGADYEKIIRRAEEIEADLIVVGPHRHNAPEMFFGTTAERVVRHGTRPVLVARAPVSGPYGNGLVASDLSAQAEAAMVMAASVLPKGKMSILHAVQRTFGGFLDDATQAELVSQDITRARTTIERKAKDISTRMGETAPGMEILLPEGPAPETVSAAVAELKADLLVMGTHGRSGVARAVLGSLAGHFLASSPIDVLSVRAP